jgi:hypothetical protein
MPTYSGDRMPTTKPDTLDVDIHCQIPDLLLGLDGIVIIRMHNTRIVEDDIQLAIHLFGFLNGCFDLRFVRDVDFDGDSGGLGVGAGGVFGFGEDAVQSLLESLVVNVCSDDFGAFFGEKNGGFETDTTKIG